MPDGVEDGRCGSGMVGEEETQVAVVHSKRSGVLLRGVALRRWIEEGQQKWMDESHKDQGKHRRRTGAHPR